MHSKSSFTPRVLQRCGLACRPPLLPHSRGAPKHSVDGCCGLDTSLASAGVSTSAWEPAGRAAALRDGTSTASTSGQQEPIGSRLRSRLNRRAPVHTGTSSFAGLAGVQQGSSPGVQPGVGAAASGLMVAADPTHNGTGSTSLEYTAQLQPQHAQLTDGHAADAPATPSRLQHPISNSAPVGDPLAEGLDTLHPVHSSPPASSRPGPDRGRDKETQEELRACEHWRDVLDVVADEAPLSLRAAATALTRLSSLTSGRGKRGRSGQPGKGQAGGGAAPANERAALLAHPGLQELLDLLFARVPDMNSVQLCNTLQAVVQLGLADRLPEPVLVTYYDTAAAKASAFSPRDIVTFLTALVALQGPRSSAPPQRELLDVLCFRACELMAAGAFSNDPRDIPTLLTSCVKLGYGNPLLGDAAAKAAAEAIEGWGPQAVSNTLWALGRMGAYHEPAVTAGLAAFRAAHEAYKPVEVSNLLWALTSFRHHPEGAFAQLINCLLSRLNALRAADVATTLYALAMFNVAPGQAVLDSLCGRLVACMQGGGGDPQQQGGAALPGANAVELATSYWALGLLGETQRPLFAQLEAALAERLEAKGLNESLQRMVFAGFLCWRLHASSEDTAPSRQPAFSALQLDRLRRTWVENVTQAGRSAARGTCLTAVRAVLELQGVRFDALRPTRDGLALIDVALQAGPDRYIALQVIVPEQHCCNTKQLLGSMRLQREVLEKNGWEVRYLLEQDLMRMPSEDAQTRFIAEFMRRLGVGMRRTDKAASGGEETRTRRPGAGTGGAAAESRKAT